MVRFSVPALVLVLAFAAMAGPVAADGGLVVRSLVHEGMATQQGDLALLLVMDDLGEATATPWISGSADLVRIVEYTSTRSLVDTGLPGAPGVTGAGFPQDPVETTLTSASLKLAAHQDYFEAHAFAVDGLVPYRASTDHRELEQVDQAHLGPFYLEEQADPTQVASDELTSRSFVHVQRPGPLALHGGGAAHTEVVLRGSFVLEMVGLSLHVQGANGEKAVESGTWVTPAVDGQDKVNEQRDTFVRLFFEGAELSLALDGGAPVVRWATAGVQLEAQGPVTFYDSNGRIGDTVLQGDRYVLEPGNVLAIAPQPDGLGVQVSEAELGTRGTIADVPAPASAALVGSGAVLALLVAIGIGLLRRVLRQPQLAEVERAIEEGEYRRAARLAGRIISRRPDDESAVLARGIALSKAGDQRRTVAELSGHLAQRTASDGSLHYVLGLAQLDLGQRDEGRASLREAVRLTPSLSAEVGARLGKAFSSPAPTTRETSGYA